MFIWDLIKSVFMIWVLTVISWGVVRFGEWQQYWGNDSMNGILVFGVVFIVAVLGMEAKERLSRYKIRLVRD